MTADVGRAVPILADDILVELRHVPTCGRRPRVVRVARMRQVMPERGVAGRVTLNEVGKSIRSPCAQPVLAWILLGHAASDSSAFHLSFTMARPRDVSVPGDALSDGRSCAGGRYLPRPVARSLLCLASARERLTVAVVRLWRRHPLVRRSNPRNSVETSKKNMSNSICRLIYWANTGQTCRARF